MASGPEHYRMAERLISLAQESTDPTVIEGGWEATSDLHELETRRDLMESAEQEARDFVAIAAVHATLAHVGLLADLAVTEGTLRPALCSAWNYALSDQPGDPEMTPAEVTS